MEKEHRRKGRGKKPDLKTPPRSYLDVYTIVREENGNDLFVRCGAGFLNQDGSLNIQLSSLPVFSELHLRAPKDTEPCWLAIPEAKYLVLEPPRKDSGQNNHWRRLGVAYGNNDGSLNIHLNLYPDPNRMRIHVRAPQTKE